jgi:hypothetical protein
MAVNIPDFAKMAVAAAKVADRVAHTCQDWKRFVAGSIQQSV